MASTSIKKNMRVSDSSTTPSSPTPSSPTPSSPTPSSPSEDVFTQSFSLSDSEDLEEKVTPVYKHIYTDDIFPEKKAGNIKETFHTPTKEEICHMLPLPNDICGIVDKYVGNPFTFVLDAKQDNTAIKIEMSSVSGNVFIDWGGEESVTDIDMSISAIHFHISTGNRVVRVYGDLTHLYFFGCEELTEIAQWGGFRPLERSLSFAGCANLSVTARDAPNLKHTTDLSQTFRKCPKLTGDFSNWDVSNVTNMYCMFEGCELFNSDLSRWDTSKVEHMAAMFEGCKNLASDLSKWNVSNVQNMRRMFFGCKSFNSDLSGWNVSNTDDMSKMFHDCTKLVGDFSKWDVSNVKDLDSMFSGCKKFKSNLSKWDVSNADITESMFSGCTRFTSDLSGWNVSNVTSMRNMFSGCKKFNSDLNNWDVSNVDDVFGMFRSCEMFNSKLDRWNISKVRLAGQMFKNCKSFNQDLKGEKWDYIKRRYPNAFDGCSSLKLPRKTDELDKEVEMKESPLETEKELLPKKPRSSYIYFCSFERAKIKRDHPEFDFGEIGRELGRRWKSLTIQEKAPYEKQAVLDRKRHYEEKKKK